MGWLGHQTPMLLGPVSALASVTRPNYSKDSNYGNDSKAAFGKPDTTGLAEQESDGLQN